MPLAVGAFLFAAGAPLATVNFFAIGAGAGIINAGIGVALSSAAQALLAPDMPAIEPSSGQLQIRQDVPPRFRSYGETVISGALWWQDVGDFNLKDDDLVLGHVLNDGRIDSIVERWIDGNVVEVDGSGNITTDPYATDLTTARFHVRLGLATETAYDEILSEWSTVARGDGLATSLVVLDTAADAEHQFEIFPNAKPEIAHRGKWSVVYDWRDSAQDRDDETTWEWRDNPIVCLAHEMTVKGGIPWAKIAANLAEWTEAAGVCDETVDRKDGTTEKRYRLVGTVVATEERKAVWRRMLDTCDGRMWQRADGSLGIQAGKWRAPRVRLTDDHIVDAEWVPGPDRLEALDGVRATYMSADHNFVEQEAEPWPTGAAVVALGESRVGRLNLSMVASHAQARRIEKRTFVRANAPRLTVRTNLAGLQLQDERTVQMEIADLGIARAFEVERWEREAGSPVCSVDLVAVGASIDDWEPETEEGTPPSVPHTLAATPLTLADGELTGLVLSIFDGDLSAGYDTDTTENATACTRGDARAHGTYGFTLDARRKVGRAIVYGSQDHGFVQGGNPTVTLKLWANNGGADVLITTLATFVDTANESAGRTLDNYRFTEDDKYSTWFFTIEHDGDPTWNICVAEFELYEWEADA